MLQFKDAFAEEKPSVIRMLFILVVCVLEGRSTNLSILKDKLGGVIGHRDRQPNSYYVRLVRFFKLPSKAPLIRSILGLCFRLLRGRIAYLLLDGTKWKLGSQWIHLMVLSVVCGGVSVPIAWIDLGKKGHSNSQERKKLIQKASKYLNLAGLILIADREYEGENWLKFLRKQHIELIIRLKAKTYRKYVDQAPGNAYSKLCKQARKRKHGASKTISIQGYDFTYVVYRNPNDEAEEELLFFISSLKNRYKIIHTYPLRWKIETCFLHLKSKGFNLEAINFKEPKKVELMMAVLTFAYVICLFHGQNHKEQIKLKTYKDRGAKQRPDISIFKLGIQWVALSIYDLNTFAKFMKMAIGRKKIKIARNV